MPPAPTAASRLDPGEVHYACDLLTGARRPLIWAGGGALRAGAAEAVGELARRLAAPVITTYMGRGLLGADHPCAVPGPAHDPAVGALWDEADVVLSVGSDFDGMMTQNWLMPQPPVLIAVNVDAADANKNYPADLTLVGDARVVLEEMLTRVHGRNGLPELQERLVELGAEVSASVNADDPQAAAFLAIMERALPANAVVVADMCIPGYWLGGYRRVPAPAQARLPTRVGNAGIRLPGIARCRAG